MEFKQVVRYLLDNSYLVILKGQPTLTLAFNKELEKSVETGLPKPTESIVVKEALPAKMTELQKRQLWMKFVMDAGIPHRVRTANGTYTVRHYSKEAINALIEIIDSLSPDDEAAFIAATNNYYKTVGYPQSLGKYLVDGTWMLEMQEWKKNRGRVQETGINRFES